MNEVIKIEHLTKDYGQGRGVFDLDFDIKKGEMFGFVGANGAGKTTTIRQIMGFLKPDAGKVTVCGLDSWNEAEKTKKYIGYVPGEIAFPDLPTGTEFIKSQAEFLGVKDLSYANYLIEKLQLDPSANLKRPRHFDTGRTHNGARPTYACGVYGHYCKRKGKGKNNSYQFTLV